jgi:hypothetical protein
MASFVRMNALLITVVFADDDGGVITQPTTATVSLKFKNTQGVTTQVNLALTHNVVLGGNGTWTTLWDSAAAQQGNVDWTAYGSGALHASQQGSFEVLANTSNNQNNSS